MKGGAPTCEIRGFPIVLHLRQSRLTAIFVMKGTVFLAENEGPGVKFHALSRESNQFWLIMGNFREKSIFPKHLAAASPILELANFVSGKSF